MRGKGGKELSETLTILRMTLRLRLAGNGKF